MKRIIIIALLLAAGIAASAQSKKVSVLGDSYSTYDGVNPPGYAPFYPNNQNDCKIAEQCWWSLYTKAKGYTLEKNDSWGGTTICTTGYGHRDVTASSMLWRFDRLGDPDIIFLFGGTNDAWAHSPVGEYKYSDWTDEDCKSLRPALSCLLTRLALRYPAAQVVVMLNSELQEEVNESFRTVCKHHGVQLVELQDVEKQNGHPSIKGMQSICAQLLDQVK